LLDFGEIESKNKFGGKSATIVATCLEPLHLLNF